MLYKIFLADDEPVIIRGLKKMINWEELNCEVIDSALNGEEAYEKIQKERPDIIISDISMPKMTGLELLRQIQEDDLDIKVILLSAYQEFQYAQEAVKFGALAYLLKPVKAAELEETIRKVQSIMHKEKHIELLAEEKDPLQSIFENMNQEYEHQDLYNTFVELGIDLKEKQFIGVCFSLEEEIKKIYPGNKYELLCFSVYKRIQEYVRNAKRGFVIKRDDNSCNLILIFDQNALKEEMKDYMEGIANVIAEEYKMNLIIGVGDPVGDITSLKHAYKTAKFAFEFHFFYNRPMIWYANINDRKYPLSFEDYNEKYKQVINSIVGGDSQLQVNEKINSLLEVIRNLHFGNRYAVLNRCTQFSMDLFRDLLEYKLTDETYRTNLQTYLEVLRKQSTYENLKEEFLKYNQIFVSTSIARYQVTDIPVIRQVKKYIKENYEKEITLNGIASMVFMNPYYFSTFFKKETGENFKNYVMGIRLKEARKILLESDIKTYELAQRVGYTNVRQFTDKFKEIYGDSPSGYKKKIKGDKN